jgi:hypothetical protein
MPQTNYLTLFTACYPILARVQKPGGVTVATTVGAGDVPNKPTPSTPTIQIAEFFSAVDGGTVVEEAIMDETAVNETDEVVEDEVEEEVEHDENGHPKPRHRKPQRVKHRR